MDWHDTTYITSLINKPGSMGWYWHDPFQLDKKKYDKKWLTNFYLHKLQLLQTNKFTNCIS